MPRESARNSCVQARWEGVSRGEHGFRIEIYTALHAESFSLTMMGLRALLDTYMVKKVGDSGTFKDKLEKLVSLGFLSAAQVLQIEPALEAGHAAAHRGFNPPPETVTFVLDVVELLLHQDLLGAQASTINASIPRRESANK
ncbi:DUF4145 domain-containing protein [Methylococcus sp. Mc7]|uniref:DUF4145 domain-containing protein n=1 Tax=Methylococcus sp. Mc7 TaxID=2860258 RepID=UPI00351D536E